MRRAGQLRNRARRPQDGPEPRRDRVRRIARQLQVGWEVETRPAGSTPHT